MKIAKLYLVIFLICLTRPKAAILFIDTNDSPKEIEAARKAAKQRNETLVVYPDQRNYRVNDDDFKNFVSQHLKQQLNGEKLKTMIISGHHSTDNFSGSKATLYRDGILKAFSENSLGKNLQSIHQWGCYSAKMNMQHLYQPAFPNLKFVNGFLGGGPANDKQYNFDALQYALQTEEEILNLRKKRKWAKIRQIIARMPNAANITPGYVFGGQCQDDQEYMITYNKIFNIPKKMNQLCNSWSYLNRHGGAVFKSYYYGKNALAKDTHNNNLRWKLYNEIQKRWPCESYEEFSKSYPDLLTTRTKKTKNLEKFWREMRIEIFHLVKWNKYAQNGSLLSELKEFDSALSAINVPINLKINIYKRSDIERKKIIEKLSKLRIYLTKKRKNLRSPAQNVRIINATYGFNALLSKIFFLKEGQSKKFPPSIKPLTTSL